MQRPLPQETLQLCIDSELPHVTNHNELKIILEAVGAMKADADGNFPKEEVDKLFHAALMNMGKHPVWNADKNKEEDGPIPIGYELKNFVLLYHHVLLQCDSSREAA